MRISLPEQVVVALTLATACVGQSRFVGRAIELPALEPAACVVHVVVPLPAQRAIAARVDRCVRTFVLRGDDRVLLTVARGERAAAFREAIESDGDIPFPMDAALVFDASGVLLAVDSIAVVLRTIVPDVLAGRIDAASASRIAEYVIDARDRGQPDPWIAELEGGLVPIDAAAVADAIEALGREPVYVARYLIAVDQASEQPFVSPAVGEWVGQQKLTAHVHPDVCRVAFTHYADTGRDGVARAWAFRWVDAQKGDARGLARLANHLADRGRSKRFVEPRRMALELGRRIDPSDVDLSSDLFDLLVHDAADWAAAERVGQVLVTTLHGDVGGLNSFAWRLLTEPPYAGNLESLALTAARAMKQCADWRTYWRLDTLALAEFENGNVTTAIELQAEAIQSCGLGSRSRYEARLDRYRAALEPGRSGVPPSR